MVFIDVTGACKSPRSTGMQRVTRRIFRELTARVSVTPISWNAIGNRYQHLGRREQAILETPAHFLQRPSARPEFRGEYFPAELHRHIFRKSIPLENELRDGDSILFPDIFRDARVRKLPALVSRRGVRSVAIFHDAAGLLLPSSASGRARFENYLIALSKLNLVICISEASRNDLLHLWSGLRVQPAETVIETWPIEKFGPTETEQLAAGRSAVLCVGSFEPRKNHQTLLRAANYLWDKGIEFDLELIGRSTSGTGKKVEAELRQLRRSNRPIRWLKQVNDDVLHRAYQACRFTVYPSLMEGFGLPIAESLLYGKPCVCGGNGALGEVARGGGCFTVDQTDADALAETMKRLLLDEQLYSQLSAEARSREFRSWPDYTDKLLTHLQTQAPTGSALID